MVKVLAKILIKNPMLYDLILEIMTLCMFLVITFLTIMTLERTLGASRKNKRKIKKYQDVFRKQYMAEKISIYYHYEPNKKVWKIIIGIIAFLGVWFEIVSWSGLYIGRQIDEFSIAMLVFILISIGVLVAIILTVILIVGSIVIVKKVANIISNLCGISAKTKMDIKKTGGCGNDEQDV